MKKSVEVTDKGWYYLDPDFRKLAKSERYCCRCQKPVTGSAIKVFVNWDVAGKTG